MPDSPRITLSRRIPLVRAVFEALETGCDLGPAVQLLREAERHHRLRILRDTEGSALCGSTYRPRGPWCPATIADFQRIAASRELLLEAYESNSHDPEAEQDLLDIRLYPFLSETWMVLAGMDFSNDHLVVFSNGTVFSFTGEAWGATLAEWANRSRWMLQTGPSGRPEEWNACEFELHLFRLIEDYDRWQDAVFEVIRLSTEAHLADDDASGRHPRSTATFPCGCGRSLALPVVPRRFRCPACGLIHDERRDTWNGPQRDVTRREDMTVSGLDKPMTAHTVDWEYGDADLERIRWGFRPAAQEDKWFAYMAGDQLFIHRSWSGELLFRAELETWGISTLSVAADVPDPQYFVRLARWVIESFLLGSERRLP